MTILIRLAISKMLQLNPIAIPIYFFAKKVEYPKTFYLGLV